MVTTPGRSSSSVSSSLFVRRRTGWPTRQCVASLVRRPSLSASLCQVSFLAQSSVRQDPWGGNRLAANGNKRRRGFPMRRRVDMWLESFEKLANMKVLVCNSRSTKLGRARMHAWKGYTMHMDGRVSHGRRPPLGWAPARSCWQTLIHFINLQWGNYRPRGTRIQPFSSVQLENAAVPLPLP